MVLMYVFIVASCGVQARKSKECVLFFVRPTSLSADADLLKSTDPHPNKTPIDGRHRRAV